VNLGLSHKEKNNIDEGVGDQTLRKMLSDRREDVRGAWSKLNSEIQNS